MLKRAVLESIFATGASAFVHLDATLPDVSVPEGQRKTHLCLQVGLNLPVPIKDLHIDDDGIECTLSFNRTPCRCFVPWDAVFGLRSDMATDTWQYLNADMYLETASRTPVVPVSNKRIPTTQIPTNPKRKLPKGWRVIK